MIGVTIHWKFRVISDVDLFEHADRVAEALLELERSTPALVDSAVSADRRMGIVEIEVSASGQSEDEAVTTGQDAVTAALRATGAALVTMVPTSLETKRLEPALKA
ncbi:MAG: hypothetical protein ACT4NY_02880 [Pseudonocardiales bacterium]